MSGKLWQQAGAVGGFLFVALLLVTFFTPGTPDTDTPTAQIGTEVADDSTGLLVNAYLGGLSQVAFLVFLAALWTALRRAEPEPGASILALLGGVATALGILIATGVTLALVFASEDNREPAAIRALFELDTTVFIGVGFVLAAFFAGVALSAIPTGALPRALGWAAAAIALLFLVGLLGIFSDDDEGGVLGILVFIGFLATLVWVLAVSVVLLRGARALPAGRVTASQATSPAGVSP